MARFRARIDHAAGGLLVGLAFALAFAWSDFIVAASHDILRDAMSKTLRALIAAVIISGYSILLVVFVAWRLSDDDDQPRK